MRFKQLLLLVSFFVFQHSFASHLSGGYITYEFQAPDMYRFHLHLMRDCSGIPSPTTANLTVSSATVPTPQSILVTFNTAMSGSLPVGPCYVPGGVSTCNGGSFFGISKDVLSSTWITLPAASDRVITYQTCCLSAGVNNLANSSNTMMFLPLVFDNQNNIPNSSPILSGGNVPIFCINTLAQVSYAATDPDGDSLAYELESIYGGYSPTAGFLPVSYNPGYSFSNPIASSTPATLDPVTGILEFTPNLNGTYQVGIKIKEYRNGIQIGSVYRSQVIIVINGLSNPALVKAKVYMDVNNNQVQDAGESNLAFIKMDFIDGGNTSTFFTDQNGTLTIPVTVGTYVLKAQAPNLTFVSSPDSNIVTISSQGSVDSSSVFGIAASGNPVNDLMVSLSGQNPRPGFARNYYLTAKNNGNTVQNAVVKLQYDSAFTAANFSTPPDSVSVGYASWNIASMQPLTYQNYTASLVLDTSIMAGINMDFIASIDPVSGDANPSDNIDSLQKIVVNSFDPNEKTVSPEGDLDVSFIMNSEWLNYTVFFQNTGTADAINIRINDVIDPSLMLNTFEITGFSHPMILESVNTNEMVFRFNNIMLPDSNSNEPMSHGFVSYRIKALPNLWVGTQILNTAHIYFDFNPAIVTNTTINTVSLTTGITTNIDEKKVFIYPNPVKEILTIRSINNYDQIEVFDVTGRSKMKFINRDDESKIDVSGLIPGFYILKLSGKNGFDTMSFIKN